MGFGLFVHWSPSVYQGSEGDNLSTPRNKINPDRFDAEQIVRAARSCGAGYVVFVAKHVGGYCAWQTETTDYSLKTSPWKHGKGDMVGELAAACRKAGLKFGVYLCPRDDYHHIGNGGRASSSDKQQEAESLYRRQLTELLTHYGPLFEVWFDGGNKIPVNDLIDKYAQPGDVPGTPPRFVALGGHGTRSCALSLLEHRDLEGRRHAALGRRHPRRQFAGARPNAMSRSSARDGSGTRAAIPPS